MFSALKKLTSGVGGRPDVAANVPMPDSLQKKFARGVQYNSEFVHINRTLQSISPTQNVIRSQ